MDFFAKSAHVPSGVKQLFEKSGVSLSLADYRLEDCPLVGVNRAFCDLSGYLPGEALGRNCRFLQPESGPGPVRDRMRAYIDDESEQDGRFVIPNERKDGTSFLNLVYMTKLTHRGEVALILGSQFAIDEQNTRSANLYDRALKEDLRQLRELTHENNWGIFGSYDALASSHSMLAQLRMD